MARVAQWDILRINRRVPADHEGNDAAILDFVLDRIHHVRREGYGNVIVGGISRGGWLALLAAALPGVNTVIALAPGTTGLDSAEQEQTGNILGYRLAATRAKRIAALFFEGDPRSGMARHAATAVRSALERVGSSFMVVDQPPDLHGRSAASGGRFARRYCDCLLQFAHSSDDRAGEFQCSSSEGYASGSEIGFPPSDPALTELPANADPAYGPFWGRWEGDDENGTYLILETVGIRFEGIVLRIGLSSGPERRDPLVGVWDLPFQLDGSRRRIYHKFPGRHDMLTVKVISESELEYQGQRAAERRFRKFGMRLHKRTS